MVELRGERVVVRPLRMNDFDLIKAVQAEISPWNTPDAAWERRFKQRIARSGRLVDGWLDLGIEVEGRLVGDIGARSPAAALPPGVFELGVSLFAHADRGRGYGREAVGLLTEYLFDELGAARVQATTAVGNGAMRRVLERLGYAYEGTLRAYVPDGDREREDYALYAVLRANRSTLTR